MCWSKVCMKSAGQWPSRSRIWHRYYNRSLFIYYFFLPESGSWGQALVSIPCCWANGLPSAVAESRHRWPALWRPERDDLASADVDEHAPIHMHTVKVTLIPRGGSCTLSICSEMRCAVVDSGVLVMRCTCDRVTSSVVRCVRQSCEWER